MSFKLFLDVGCPSFPFLLAGFICEHGLCDCVIWFVVRVHVNSDYAVAANFQTAILKIEMTYCVQVDLFRILPIPLFDSVLLVGVDIPSLIRHKSTFKTLSYGQKATGKRAKNVPTR